MEETQGVRLHNLRDSKMRRSLSAVGGIFTASKASHALADAIRWLTGQMPQMRAISDGISVNGRPSQNFSKPRNCVTWKRASSTLPMLVEMQRNLGVALDAGHRIDNDGSACLPFSQAPKRVFALNSGWRPCEQFSQRVIDHVGGRRTAGNEEIDGNHSREPAAHRATAAARPGRRSRRKSHILAICPIVDRLHRKRIAHRRNIRRDRAVAQRNQQLVRPRTP